MNSLNPRKPYASFLAGLAVALTVAACGGGGGGGGDDDKVALDKPDDLMAALDDKVTANGTPLQQVVGQPPATTGLTPKIEEIPESTAVPGDTVTLPINFPANTDLQALFAKVPNAGSYFQASVAPGGKIAKATTGGFTVFQTVSFQVDVPENLQTGGRFCIEVKLRDAAQNVGEPAQVCINVVATAPAAPTNDQPTAAEFGPTLLGNWATSCISIESEESTAEDFKGAKLVLGFAPGKTFSETIEFYSTATCTGSPSDSFVGFIDGAWETTPEAVYSEQSKRWQRPFTFNPNDPDPSFDLEPCYNVLSFNAAATQLYLGVPNTFTFDDGTGPTPGDCSAEDTRPAAVFTSLPFTKR
ncbi:MAG TPA: hypothetical protein VGE51_08045 [Fontimonas sp.]